MKRYIRYVAAFLALALLFLTACSASTSTTERRNYYEIFVASFYDSDGNGMGDLQGITEKLDYLTELGVNAIWLMPISPSPSYHKYDVTDYYGIDPQYGTMKDFEKLISESRKRGIDIIIDLVLNHSSSRHPWFVEATTALKNGSDSKYIDYYVFAEERVNSYYHRVFGTDYWYEGIFWEGMPDLNMDNEELRKEVEEICKFWLKKGVKGFRLDAAKHVYNLPIQNYEFWSWFSEMCKGIKSDVFLIAEIWDTDNVIIPYYETGLSAMFNFSFAGPSGVIHQSAIRGDGVTLSANILRMDKLIRSRAPDGINSPFLSNHDTDRSAGYINDLTLQKLQAAIYLMIPGSPFIYYGEEIGMTGAGKDENKRTAMLWSTTDATGMTRNPVNADLYIMPPEQGVQEQLADPNSLLNYYRDILKLKARYPDIMDGEVTENYTFDNRAICAFRAGDVIIMHNLSTEPAEADMSVTTSDNQSISLGGFISPSGGTVELSGNTLTMSPYASAVLQVTG